MTSNWKRWALLAVGFVFLFESRPLVWGPDGHKIVCAIAEKLLAEADAKVVRQLARGYQHPDGAHSSSFASGCTFADEARANAEKPDWTQFKRFNEWHFLNVPRTTTSVPDDCTNCIFKGVSLHATEFGNQKLTEQRRGRALLLLGHWVGDIHQPLHISFKNDLGGNKINVDGTYGATQLHKVWDGRMLLRARDPKDWWTYAGDLAAAITPAERKQWTATDPQAWAQESYDITVETATEYCRMAQGGCQSIPGTRHLKPAYQTAFEDRMEQRLKQAGVRLAALIARALHP